MTAVHLAGLVDHTISWKVAERCAGFRSRSVALRVRLHKPKIDLCVDSNPLDRKLLQEVGVLLRFSGEPQLCSRLQLLGLVILCASKRVFGF